MGNGTSIGRVRGLGSAHSGAHHWLLQRFTAIGNLVLTVWLAISFLTLGDFTYMSVHDWLAHPVPAAALSLLIVSSFWHARLGMQVVIEDYVHDAGLKFAAIAALTLATFGGAAFGIFAIVRIALGAA